MDAMSVIHYALRITHYALRITHYALRITHYALRITHYAHYALRITHYADDQPPRMPFQALGLHLNAGHIAFCRPALNLHR